MNVPNTIVLRSCKQLITHPRAFQCPARPCLIRPPWPSIGSSPAPAAPCPFCSAPASRVWLVGASKNRVTAGPGSARHASIFAASVLQPACAGAESCSASPPSWLTARSSVKCREQTPLALGKCLYTAQNGRAHASGLNQATQRMILHPQTIRAVLGC